MSRKPANDTFTRFTSSTPSYSSPQPSNSFTSSQPPSQQQPPSPSSQPTSPARDSNETPKERVARLRAEHLRKRAAEISTTDRVLSSGRRVADGLHRATTYTLLGFSAVATVVAAYGLVSLVSHNRTQKRAWIEREMDRLEGARAAFLRGEADAEQLHLLEQERAGEEIKKKWEADKQRRKDEGWFGSVRKLFRSEAAQGDMGSGEARQSLKERGERLRESGVEFEEEVLQQRRSGRQPELVSAVVAESSIPGVGLDEKGRPVPLGKMQRASGAHTSRDSPILDAVQASVVRQPGQLDVLADNVSHAGSNWLGTIFGRGSKS